MDETHITNHQYAEFLNKVLPSVKVENGVVLGNAEIWLLLGEVKEGYEPIVFQDGKFSVKGAHHAACAVLRVTAFGALAYAHFYGKSLPTEEQWMYVMSAGAAGPAGERGMSVSSAGISGHGEAEGHGGPAPAPEPTPAPEAGTSLPIPSPVMLYPANELGIRGLNANVGEWGIRTVNAPVKGGQGQEEYVVLGDVSGQSAQGAPAARAIRRYPWEAFAEVGFRGVRKVPVSTKSAQLPGAGEVEPKPASR
jgi:serine/threonine-protein kinase